MLGVISQVHGVLDVERQIFPRGHGLLEFLRVTQKMVDFVRIESQIFVIGNFIAPIRTNHGFGDMRACDVHKPVLVETPHGVTVKS